MEATTAKLRQRLSAADEDDLANLVAKYLSEMTLATALVALKNPFANRQVIESLCSNRDLLRSTALRREIVAHRRTSEVRALRLLAGLGWRDLIEIGGNVRIRPTVRRAANLNLSARIPGLAVGERVIIARRASPELVQRILGDTSRRVIAALLENPRLTEFLLLPFITNIFTSPEILKQIADHALWNRRKPVQRALCLNSRTPPATASALLPSIGKRHLQAVVANGRIVEVVRAKARTLLGIG